MSELDCAAQLDAEKDPLAEIILTKEGNPKACLANALLHLRHQWKDVLAFNEFNLYVITKNPAPWQPKAGANWTDADDSLCTEWLQRQGIMVATHVTAEAIQMVAREHSFHPVRDYLKSLTWDGMSRLDKWLISYLGAPDTTFIRAVGARWLIAAVARVFEPGCQADHVLLLEGKQGIGKSSALRVLAGDEWFTDHISDLGSKDSRIELCGRWIVELAELDKVRHAERERVKAFLTERADNFRPPYGRRAQSISRGCVFAATTNDFESLTDETGNRRFWPVRCSVINVSGLKIDRDQVWAEAYKRYSEGAAWWIDTAELNAAAAEEQDDRYEADVWDDKILAWCQNPVDACDSDRHHVTLADILVHAIGKPLDKITQQDRKRVQKCLVHAGYTKKQDRSRGKNRGKRFYVLANQVEEL